MPKSSRKKRSVRKYRLSPKPLKEKMTKHLCKRKDICCEKDYNREKLINLIINKYKDYFGEEYVDFLDNNLAIFVGYKMDMEKSGDKLGLKIFKEIQDKFPTSQPIQSISVYKEFMKELPLYYLLSILGDIEYKKMA